MKTVAATLQVARSNLIERRDGSRRSALLRTVLATSIWFRRPPPRRPAAHLWLSADRRAPQARAAIRRTPARQRQAHLPPDEEARIAAAALYGRRRPGEHDGKIITIRSDIRWCADALEFTCWNGEIVHIAFVLDCHDREVIAWLATTAGDLQRVIRDMMIECVERRFGGSRAPHKVQWLTDNGSIFAAYKTMDIALALNLEPCFTPVPQTRAKKLQANL